MAKEQDTRALLLDITFEEVYTNGYQGASVLKILKKAGLHKGSMYHFFENKKEMVLACIREKSKEIFGTKYEDILKHSSSYLEHFQTMLLESYPIICERGCPLANLIQEMSNIDADFELLLKERYERLRDNIEKIIVKAIDHHELECTSSYNLSLFMLSVFEGAILSTKALKDKAIYDNTIKSLFSVLKQNQHLF